MQPHPCAYEHWRFDAGFMQGFEDQKDFIKLSPGVTFAIIGFRDQWGKGRAAEHEQSFGGNEFLWEFGKWPIQLQHSSPEC